MGNTSCSICKKTTLVSCCIFVSRSSSSSSSCHGKRAKVVKVVKSDGKVLTFTSPILVKDVLVRLSDGDGGRVSGIGVSKEANSERLSNDYELKIGKVYYVLPCLSSERSFSPAKDESCGGGGIKRIKIVITKQQLKELLAKKISVEEVLSEMEKKTSADHHSAENWKPNLESIPEEVEGLC